MASTTFNLVKKENSYRCPACGEMVDNGQREAIRLHHDHVLHPAQYRYVTLPTAPFPAVAPRKRMRL